MNYSKAITISIYINCCSVRNTGNSFLMNCYKLLWIYGLSLQNSLTSVTVPGRCQPAVQWADLPEELGTCKMLMPTEETLNYDISTVNFCIIIIIFQDVAVNLHKA